MAVENGSSRRITISKETTAISLSLVIAIVGGALWMGSELSGLSHRIDLMTVKIESSIEKLGGRVATIETRQLVTVDQVERWISTLKSLNEGQPIRIPNFR